MIADLARDLSRLVRGAKEQLMEKDIILHQLLADLYADAYLAGNLAFKGGTCLVKHYLRYYRFSEDLDFTWKRQEGFRGATRSQFEARLDPVLDAVGERLERIASKRNPEFRYEKGNREFVTLVSRGKFTTFKLYYVSGIAKERAFVKVQVNFADTTCFGHVRGDLRSLVGDPDPALARKHPEYAEYASTLSADVYDVREILSEKVRAVLTRRVPMARDFVDAYMIHKSTGLLPEDVEACAIRKTELAVKSHARYRNNFLGVRAMLEEGGLLEWKSDDGLLTEAIDDGDFEGFVSRLEGYLRGLAGRIDVGLPRGRPRRAGPAAEPP